MSNKSNLFGRVAAGAASCAFALCLTSQSSAMSQHGRAARARHNARQGQTAQPQQPAAQPKKKKLPPGVRGFDQFANRDASDKLIAGGATRNEGRDAAEAEAILKLDQGWQAYKDGKFADAAAAFARAAELEPAWFRAQFRLGTAYEAQGKFREAAASYAKAVALSPDMAVDDALDPFKAQYNLANSLAQSEQHEAAVGAYRKLIDLLPAPIPTPYYNLGISYVALGRTGDAAEAFRKAVEIKPDYAEAHYNLGLLASRAERYPEAVGEFKEAIKSKPDYADARYSLGLVCYLTDDRAGLAEQQKALQDMKSKLAADLAKLK
jgi:tetratricopeptide (TPR) repeat protein